jgi:hypothetical protein
MKSLFSLFAVAALVLPSQASADEFADVDQEALARGVQRLADAWTIQEASFVGATDDFANEEAFEPPVPRKRDDAAIAAYGDSSDIALEQALLGLFTEDEIGLVIGEVGKRRRLRD